MAEYSFSNRKQNRKSNEFIGNVTLRVTEFDHERNAASGTTADGEFLTVRLADKREFADNFANRTRYTIHDAGCARADRREAGRQPSRHERPRAEDRGVAGRHPVPVGQDVGRRDGRALDGEPRDHLRGQLHPWPGAGPSSEVKPGDGRKHRTTPGRHRDRGYRIRRDARHARRVPVEPHNGTRRQAARRRDQVRRRDRGPVR